jgi:hypothetical protein
MWKQDFIAVDFESVRSYLGQGEQQANQKPYGDFGGHLRLIDTMFDAIDPQFIKESAPGYKGEVKILGSLVFDDLYPLIASLTQRPIDLWPLAILHPSQVYTGPTVPSQ